MVKAYHNTMENRHTITLISYILTLKEHSEAYLMLSGLNIANL